MNQPKSSSVLWRNGLRTASIASKLAVVLVLAHLARQPLMAQTYTVLHRFTGGADGGFPEGLIRDTAGNLYGVTSQGGVSGLGTVFKLTGNTETVLYNFAGGAGGDDPEGSLLHSGGVFYGATAEGGLCEGSCGTVFKLDSTGHQSVLYSFTGGTDGDYPNGSLVNDAAENLYGTTSEGGASTCVNGDGEGCGTVFKVDQTGKETVLYNFTGTTDGWGPQGGLVRVVTGALYGTTINGGNPNCNAPNGCGVVFKLDASGRETVLHAFVGGADGAYPPAGLIRDASGNLYGTTGAGGDLSCFPPNGCGVVFKLDKFGTETILYTFVGKPDAAVPQAGLVLDASGNLYGTTIRGGSKDTGTVFKLSPNQDGSWTESVLHSFAGWDGANPQLGNLVVDVAGNIYGATLTGGISGCSGLGCGIAFKITQ